MTIRDWYRVPSCSGLRMTNEYRGEPTAGAPRWDRPGICRTAYDFLRVFDRAALEGLERLLATPDEVSLRVDLTKSSGVTRRGRVLRFDGADNRFRTWLPVRVRAIRARELAQFGLADSDADKSEGMLNG